MEVFVRDVFEVWIDAFFTTFGGDFDAVWVGGWGEGDLASRVRPGSFYVDLLLLAFEVKHVHVFVEPHAEVAVERMVLPVIGAIGATIDLVDGELSGPLAEEGDDFFVAAAHEC